MPSPPAVPSELDDQDAATADLLDRARAGDAGALDQLFARHLPGLKRFASGRLPRWARDIADTTDLVQDTLVDTLKRLDRFEYRGDGALTAYLRQAVMNRIRNEFRRLARHGSPEALEPTLEGTGTSPLEAAIGQQTLARYEAGLQRLTPEERDAVVARVEFGMSYDEVAQVLGKPTANAARMAVVRALVRLAREMKPGAIPPPAVF